MSGQKTTRPTGGTGGISAGAALFAKLGAIGVDYAFCNSGTDFPPIIEGLAEAAAGDVRLPEALVMPHEHAAMGMAHGYWFATGRPQAVILHTNVGLANGAIGAINAATDRVPMLIMSGRTPVMEAGRFGARTVPIGWGQEMRDQTALIRESVKWDYELKFPEQIGDLIDRAHAIALSPPSGPVYLSLPREVLCETVPAGIGAAPSRQSPNRTAPDPGAIEDVAKLLARAKTPVIFAQRGAGSPEAFAALSRLAEAFAIPVCQWWAVATAVASDHPCNVGADPEPWISEADVILVIDALAPWSPDVHRPRPDARIIQIGPDPLFSNTPVRHFPSAISIASETADGILALEAALAGARPTGIRARRKRIRERVGVIRTECQAIESAHAMTKPVIARALTEAIGNRKATVFSELGCPLDHLHLTEHNSWHQEPHSGGLGWSFPCAMGFQLADRDRLVVATMGDGSYIFSNPVACHQIAEALALPVLVVILNNGGWDAVRHSVVSLYPDGHAARANRVPLTTIEPIPDFTRVAAASRAFAIAVDRPADLKAGFETAIAHIETEGSLALVDVRMT